MGIQFDWTISLGSLIGAIIFVISCIGLAIRVRADMIVAGRELIRVEEKFGEQMKDVKGDVREIRSNMKELATTLITVARQDERLGYMQAEINDLKKHIRELR